LQSSNGSSVCAILAAAGQGVRFGRRKQLLELGGKPLAAWSLEVFARSPEVAHVVIACEPEERTAFERLAHEIVPRKLHAIVSGGARRQDSVFAALRAVRVPVGIAVVHDGARPFVSIDLLTAVIERARTFGAAIAAVPVKDTIKQVAESGVVLKTIPRDRVWAAQTPQAFGFALLLEAHEDAEEAGFGATDDAELVERLGSTTIAIVESTYENLKITTSEDLVIAERIAASRMQTKM
jgi:2-C-methyl-D-erythritol 4-phosphate cytidylyltransferase